MAHIAQQIAYNAGWCKGRWPNDDHYAYQCSDFADEAEYTAGLTDGIRARLQVSA